MLLLLVLPFTSLSQRLFDYGPLTDGSNFVLQGTKWNKRTLKYHIENSSSHLTSAERENTIRNAFATWQNASTLTFIQVNNINDADLKIK